MKVEKEEEVEEAVVVVAAAAAPLEPLEALLMASSRRSPRVTFSNKKPDPQHGQVNFLQMISLFGTLNSSKTSQGSKTQGTAAARGRVSFLLVGHTQNFSE